MKGLSKVKEFIKSRPILIGTGVAVLLILAGVSYPVLSNSSPAEPPPQIITSPKPPAPPPKSNPPPLSFEQKIENLKKIIADVCATGESKEITLVFTETEANNQAAKLVAQAEIPEDIPLDIESVHIDFQPDNNVLTEARSVIYNRFKVTIKIKAMVDIEEGKPEVEVTSISFGFVPLPKPLKDKISDFITQKIDSLQSLAEAELGGNGKIDLEFRNIKIQDSKVTITLLIKPRA